MKKILLMTLLLATVAPPMRAADPDTLIVAFQPQENPDKLQLKVQPMAEYLSKQLGMPVKVYLPTDYAAVVEALRAGHAHVAYFSAWPYMLAHRLAGAEVIAAELRNGQPFYYSQWYARADSPIHSLKDAKGKTAAFTDPSSTSGYLFPTAKLVEDGLLEKRAAPSGYFARIMFAGGYEQALKALVNGQVDVAAASDYALTKYLTPEDQQKIKVISRQGPVPTHCIAVTDKLGRELRQRITSAFLELNEPGHKDLLKSVYGADRLVAVTHEEHTAALQKALEETGLDYVLTKK